MERNDHGEIILYQSEDLLQIEVRLDNKTVWLTQQQIAELFGTQRPAITKHLRNIFAENELLENSVCSILEHTATDRKTYATKFYNLDAILSIGYRVNSKNATQFRIWANTILKEFLLKRYVLNQRMDRMEKKLIELKLFTKSHDRFLILDQKTVYHIGASLKDLGKRWFAFSKIEIDAQEMIQKLTA